MSFILLDFVLTLLSHLDLSLLYHAFSFCLLFKTCFGILAYVKYLYTISYYCSTYLLRYEAWNFYVHEVNLLLAQKLGNVENTKCCYL
jgi:hypothetical protein